MDALNGAHILHFPPADARPPARGRRTMNAKQEDRMKRLLSIAAASLTAAFLAATTPVSAQDSNINQRTYLTFSGPVQMPGVTLPAGKYVFRLADTALRNVMQVFDADEQHIIGQWFFIGKNRTTEEQSAANGKPVVTFREMPEGMTPAIQYFFYPTDLTGKEFIYPKDQALKIAAATHQPVLATDTDVAKGGEPHVFTVEPNGSESSYSASGQVSENTAATPAAAPAPAAENRSTDLSTDRGQQATATSGTYQQNAEPRQEASNRLPKTASPLQLIGLLGLVLVTCGVGLRMARSSTL